MESPYVIIKEQTDARIELARGWQAKGFYFFATSTILQAYDAVERFERRLDGVRSGFFRDYSPQNFDRICHEINLTDTFSGGLRNDIRWAVREMGKLGN